jgi:hypothetical protein
VLCTLPWLASVTLPSDAAIKRAGCTAKSANIVWLVLADEEQKEQAMRSKQLGGDRNEPVDDLTPVDSARPCRCEECLVRNICMHESRRCDHFVAVCWHIWRIED